MNYLEKTTLLALVDEYGELWESGEEDLIYEKLQLSIGAYETATKSFMMNPSAYYYNILISNKLAQIVSEMIVNGVDINPLDDLNRIEGIVHTKNKVAALALGLAYSNQ